MTAFNNLLLNVNWTILQPNISVARPERVTTPLEIVSAIVCVLAVAVNVSVLLVIYIGPRAFRTPTFFVISSLATADMLTGITVLFAIFLPVNKQIWERIVLKGLAVVSFSASVNNLVVIASDRYFKIRDEVIYNKVFTHCNVLIFIVLSWILAFAVFLVAPLLGWSCNYSQCVCPKGSTCKCDSHTCSQTFVPFTKTYLIVGVAYFYLSLTIMLALYASIFIFVRNRGGCTRLRQGSVIGRISTQGPFVMIHRRREVKLAKTLAIVMGVFFICWLPVTTLFFFDINTNTKDRRYLDAFDYCLTSTVIHPLINPIIYSMRLPRMWRTFKHLRYAVCRRICRTKSLSSSWSRNRHRGSLRSVIRQINRAESASSYQQTKLKLKSRQVSVNYSLNTQVSNLTQPSPTNLSLNESNVFVNDHDDAQQSSIKTLTSRAVVFEKNKSWIDKDKLQSNDKKYKNHLHKQHSFNEIKNNGSVFKRMQRSYSSSCSIKLTSGVVVPRENLSISPPFDLINKLTWK